MVVPATPTGLDSRTGMADATYILGINAWDHDVSACLLRNGEIVAAVAKERVTRVKHDSGFYSETVEYCLDALAIGLDDVDLIVRNCYILPVPELERRLLATHLPFFLGERERARAEVSPLFLQPDGPRFATCSHHLAHAYSAFGACPFEEGAVMILDGIGSYRRDVLEPVPPGDEAHPCARESESYYRFRGSDLETLKKVWMGPVRGILNDEFGSAEGLGAIYSKVSSYIFGHWDRCGEVMGLAPYGRPGFPPLFDIGDGNLRVHEWPPDLRHPFVGTTDQDWASSPRRREWEDLAWRVQEDTEQAILRRAAWLHERTQTDNLVLAGGVALNCVANGKLLEKGPFRNIWIQPAAGDDGTAIGCALYGHLKVRRNPRRFVMRSAFLGRSYPDEECAAVTRRLPVRLSASVRRPPDIAAETARLLAAGATVGWHQGRSEFGPRALGHRSILADPRDPRMKDRLNARVKHRQAFRPFAPVVVAERAGEFFEGEAESPYMLLVRRVRPEAAGRIPAIVHVDGTARVQTLRREADPRLYDLLLAFDRVAGVPLLVNTSFNLRGEPVVETPAESVECFLSTQMDALALGDLLLRKRASHAMLFPLVRFLVNLRRNVRSERLMERAARRVLSGD